MYIHFYNTNLGTQGEIKISYEIMHSTLIFLIFMTGLFFSGDIGKPLKLLSFLINSFCTLMTANGMI